MRKNKRFLLVLCTLSFLAGCAGQSSNALTGNGDEPGNIISFTAKEDCWLCGNRTDTTLYPYWGQNNVGVISLNTFEVMPVVINRYDMDGTPLEEQAGVLTSRCHDGGDEGYSSYSFEDADRGYAYGSVTLHEDETLDPEKAASFLCQDCLDRVLSYIYKEGYGVGVINFETGELRPFEKGHVGFTLGDYYISCDFVDTGKREYDPGINFLIFYAPLRYE